MCDRELDQDAVGAFQPNCINVETMIIKSEIETQNRSRDLTSNIVTANDLCDNTNPVGSRFDTEQVRKKSTLNKKCTTWKSVCESRLPHIHKVFSRHALDVYLRQAVMYAV